MTEQQNKQLKSRQLSCYCDRTDCCGRIKDNHKYDSLVQKQEREHQEFIKYLENYIELLNDEPDAFENSQNEVLEEVLEKYKEVIK